MGRPLGIDWDTQPLGAIADYMLAEKLGCTAEAVRKARIARGIKSPRALATPRRRINWDRVLSLGVEPDAEVARVMDVSAATVRAARLARGIPAPRLHRSRPLSRGIQWDRVLSDGTRIPLGRVPDREIADWLGVSYSAVRQAREKRGIPRL